MQLFLKNVFISKIVNNCSKILVSTVLRMLSSVIWLLKRFDCNSLWRLYCRKKTFLGLFPNFTHLYILTVLLNIGEDYFGFLLDVLLKLWYESNIDVHIFCVCFFCVRTLVLMRWAAPRCRPTATTGPQRDREQHVITGVSAWLLTVPAQNQTAATVHHTVTSLAAPNKTTGRPLRKSIRTNRSVVERDPQNVSTNRQMALQVKTKASTVTGKQGIHRPRGCCVASSSSYTNDNIQVSCMDVDCVVVVSSLIRGFLEEKCLLQSEREKLTWCSECYLLNFVLVMLEVMLGRGRTHPHFLSL